MLCPKCHTPLADESDGAYICCADAPMRWQCGQCGKVSEGFAFPYGHCPQCGGKLSLLQHDPAPGTDRAALEAVRMAFEIELGGRAFYQRAAAEVEDDELRTLFGRLAVMEGEHMETLSRRYHVEPPAPAPGFRVELAAVFAEVHHQPRDADNMFRIAIGLEKRAAGFFAVRSSRAPVGSAEQRLFIELAAEERSHIALLTTEYERWRARKPGLLSGDPLVEAARARRPAQAPSEPINAAELLLAAADPQRVALVCGDRELTYAQLRDRVARAAGFWRSHGLKPGDRVAIKLPDGFDWVVAYLSTIWAGGVAVGVNPQIPAPEWHYILDEAGFSFILAVNGDDTPAPWNERVMRVAEVRGVAAATAPVEPQRVDDTTPAFWCHSSGTSGKPKAVVHPHAFAREVERISRERIGITGADRLFATSRLFFAYPLTNSLFAGLKLGATLILDSRWPTAEIVGQVVQKHRPTVLLSVPSLYRNLLHAGLAPALAAAGVRRCVSAGEALPDSLRAAWRDATGLAMLDGYGASETLVLVLTAKDGDDGLQPSTGVQVQPLDGDAAAAGVPTRLCFRVSTLALGYLDRPAAQAQAFLDGGFCPADLFLRTQGGGWRFAGREDSLVKIKGRWVNLVDVEERLGAGTADLLEGACVCVPDGDGVDTLAYFYVARTGAGPQLEQVLRERAAELPPHQRPLGWHRLDALPRGPTGKLLRRKLVEALRGGAVS